MSVKTSNFTVDDVHQNPITATIACRSIRVGPANGTASYDFRAPAASNSPVRKFNGEVTVIVRPSPGKYQQGSYGDTGLFQPGDIVGYLTNVTGLGSLTFQMEEFQ